MSSATEGAISIEAAARVLGNARPRVRKTCSTCGRPFYGVNRVSPEKRVEPTYCSASCRTKAYILRKRQAKIA